MHTDNFAKQEVPFVFIDIPCLPSSFLSLDVKRGSEPADTLTMDRRILFFLTSVWPSSSFPSQRKAEGLTDRPHFFPPFHARLSQFSYFTIDN